MHYFCFLHRAVSCSCVKDLKLGIFTVRKGKLVVVKLVHMIHKIVNITLDSEKNLYN